MKFRPSVFLPLFLAATCSAFCQVATDGTQAFKGATNLVELQERLQTLVTQKKYASATWGVKVVLQETGESIFEHNPDVLLSPASNSKLYTVGLALDKLGEDYRVRTSFLAQSKPDAEGVVKGDLVVFGRGDPTLNSRIHGSVAAAMQTLVDALTNAGVRRIEGDLVGDTSFIKGAEFGSGWAWDDQFYYYGAEISALTINDNLIEAVIAPGEKEGEPCAIHFDPPTTLIVVSNLTKTTAKGAAGSIELRRAPSRNLLYVFGDLPLQAKAVKKDVTLHEPAAFFIEQLAQALAKSGVAVKGEQRVVGWMDKHGRGTNSMQQIAYVESPAMRELAREIQKPSQNLYTDLILASVGEAARSNTTPWTTTSEELGIAELNRFVQKAGVQRGHVLFEEGSGLSRNNLTTPSATVELLRYMSKHKCADVYIRALPIAGVDGTLRSRMKSTPAAGRVRAKTGTLRWANSLSGYATALSGERFVFSIMLNRFHNTDPSRSARADVDAIAVELAGFKSEVDTGQKSHPAGGH